MPTFVSAADDRTSLPPPTSSPSRTPAPVAALSHGSPWSMYSRQSQTAPMQDLSHDYTTLPQPPTLVPSHLQNRPISSLDNRPRSSPSTFGPSAESINWPDPRGGINFSYTMNEGHPGLVSNYTPPLYQSSSNVSGREIFASPSPPALQQPQPRRQYHALAPNPTGGPGFKRGRDDVEEFTDAAGKRRRRTASIAGAELNEDDRLLVNLKEDEGLPWKDIAARFSTQHGKTFQVAALQMRYKRLREKFRPWLNEDVEALNLAHEYWEKYKWDIISSKVS